MTTPSMPSGFVPLVSAYGMGAPGGVMRSEVAGGSSRYALEFDRGVQSFNVTLVLDTFEFSVWNAFFIGVIKKGAVSFNMLLDSGFGVSPHLCNIVPGSYSTARTIRHVTVGFQVEAEPQAYSLSDDEAAGLIFMYETYGGGSPGLLARLAQFANVDSTALDTV